MRARRASLPVHPTSSYTLPIPDRELTLGHTLNWSTERYADREAVAFGDRRWTYQQLGRDVEACARALIAVGVGKGTRVGLVMGSRPEFVIAAYAVASVGGVCVFVSTFSTDDELDWILRHGDVAILLTHARVRQHPVLAGLVDRHPSIATSSAGEIVDLDLPYLRRVVEVPGGGPTLVGPETWSELLGRGEALDARIVDARRAEVVPDDDAMLLYTSGSSARPKAVLHVHRAPSIQGFRMADAMAIGPDDRTLTSFPFFWTAGWATGVAAPLAVGACAVLQEFFDPTEAAELIERERITSLRQMAHDELRLVSSLGTDPHDLSSVEVGVTTEALRPFTSVQDEATEICGWGMSETFTNHAMHPFDAPIELRRTTMGRLMAGNRIRIRDPETAQELPPGTVGEIMAAGPAVMRGYYKGEPMSPVDDAGFLPTGDTGYFDADGNLVFCGRLDRLIKTGGANVSPLEIEDQLQRWGRISTCAVVGVPHPTLGQAVVLCVVPAPEDRVTERDILEHLRQRLATYKVPRAVVFLDRDELPLTANSKLNAPLLRERAVRQLLASDIDRQWHAHLTQPV
jgi:fatty-acyl-CoA synthase